MNKIRTYNDVITLTDKTTSLTRTSLYEILEKIYNTTLKLNTYNLSDEITDLKYICREGLPNEQYGANFCTFKILSTYYEIGAQFRDFKRCIYFFKCVYKDEMLFSIIADWGKDSIEVDNKIEINTMLQILKNVQLFLENHYKEHRI